MSLQTKVSRTALSYVPFIYRIIMTSKMEWIVGEAPEEHGNCTKRH